MSLKGFMNKSLMQGVLGNLSEISPDQLGKEFGEYLMENETITVGYKLVRDVFLFTDKRLLFFDKQGATGTKMRVKSINLESVISVTVETAGFGMDDSELSITYITTPNLRANNISTETIKLEFPKKYSIQGLYKILQQLAYNNFASINNL